MVSSPILCDISLVYAELEYKRLTYRVKEAISHTILDEGRAVSKRMLLNKVKNCLVKRGAKFLSEVRNSKKKVRKLKFED